jgi:hypothetical protein
MRDKESEEKKRDKNRKIKNRERASKVLSLPPVYT